jgi:hypothetical protein
MTALTQIGLQTNPDSPVFDTGDSRAELIADTLGLPESHWLVDAIDDALSSGDAIFLLGQCRKHLTPRCAR